VRRLSRGFVARHVVLSRSARSGNKASPWLECNVRQAKHGCCEIFQLSARFAKLYGRDLILFFFGIFIFVIVVVVVGMGERSRCTANP